MLFDSHCHFDFTDFDSDRDQLLRQCFSAGITRLCIPATTRHRWPTLQSLLGEHDSGVRIYGALGLHPYFLQQHTDDDLIVLDQQLAQRPDTIVAVGEAGLDLQIDQPDLPHQKQLLEVHIELASRHGLPLILHGRKSHDQLVSLLRKHRFKEGGIIHAWSGSDQQADAFTQLGFKLGIGGNLTYARAQRLQRQVAQRPLEHFVLETDAPDMPPAHLRGQRNTPLTLVSVLEKVASLRQQDKTTVAEQLLKTTLDVFQLPYT